MKWTPLMNKTIRHLLRVHHERFRVIKNKTKGGFTREMPRNALGMYEEICQEVKPRNSSPVRRVR